MSKKGYKYFISFYYCADNIQIGKVANIFHTFNEPIPDTEQGVKNLQEHCRNFAFNLEPLTGYINVQLLNWKLLKE